MKLKIGGIDFDVNHDQISFEGGRIKTGSDAMNIALLFHNLANRKLSQRLTDEALEAAEKRVSEGRHA